MFLQGCFEAAIEDYTQAIGLNPRHCRAYYNRAFSHDRLGQYEEAVADYSRALRIEPANATALHNRGSLLSGWAGAWRWLLAATLPLTASVPVLRCSCCVLCVCVV